MINPFILANRQGIPRLESTGVTVGTDSVTFSFKEHQFLNNPYLGLIVFKLPAIPTGTTTTLPIIFKSGTSSQNVTTFGGTALTVASMSGSGIVLGFYDSSSNTLQLINS